VLAEVVVAGDGKDGRVDGVEEFSRLLELAGSPALGEVAACHQDIRLLRRHVGREGRRNSRVVMAEMEVRDVGEAHVFLGSFGPNAARADSFR
jgi:hypothetical protein